MDSRTERQFRYEIETQCQFVLLAARQLADAEASVHIWFALQAILVSAANLSKLMWGSGQGSKRTAIEADRRKLRKTLGVTYRSPLRSPDLRNGFEHFDEELEKRKPQSLISRNIGPPRAFQIKGMKARERFGHYDPSTGRVTFWRRQSVSIPKVIGEVERILPLAKVF